MAQVTHKISQLHTSDPQVLVPSLEGQKGLLSLEDLEGIWRGFAIAFKGAWTHQRDLLLNSRYDGILTACKEGARGGTHCAVHTFTGLIVHDR